MCRWLIRGKVQAGADRIVCQKNLTVRETRREGSVTCPLVSIYVISYRIFVLTVLIFVVSTRRTSSSSNIVAASTLEGKPNLSSASHNFHHPPAGTETKPASAPTPDSQSQSTGESDPQPADAKSGAFDPETGEINWDCPCLGGMAHGPCGPEFREAFSCFVYSEKEPKGIDCVEKFRGMQDCFREHPEVYAEGTSPV